MNFRSIGIGALCVLALALGLWGVWILESGSAASGSGDSEFSYKLADESDGKSNIILFCPEDGIADASVAFSKWLKLDGIPVQIPGSIMILARLNGVNSTESLAPVQRAFVEVLKRYSARRVVLVAHTNCLYYDTVAAWNDDLAGVRKRQIEDLDAATRVLQQWFPRAEISGFLAEEEPDRQLVFRSLDKLNP